MSPALSMVMSMLMSRPIPGCPGLFLPSWGDIQKRGRGQLLLVSEKTTEYKCMELGRGVQVPDGKNREMGATPSSVVRCKSFRQETSQVSMDRCLPMSLPRTVPMSMDKSKVDV
jgi:hypothetical protein